MASGSPVIILPEDMSGHRVEELRKTLLATVRDPRRARFDELRMQGLDSESAASISGLDQMDTTAQAVAVLEDARYSSTSPAYELLRSGSYEVPAALRQVGSAAGAATGSALGIMGLRFVAKNAAVFGAGVGVALTIGGCLAAHRVVSKGIGVWAAAIAVGNIASAAGLIGLSLWRLRR